MVLSRRTVACALLLVGLVAHPALAHPSSDATATSSANGVRFPSTDGKNGKDVNSGVKDSETSGAAARLGFLTNSIYPGTYSSATGQYASASPLKLDLGGLLVGGAIGLGLIFLVPKLFQPYGGCYSARSVDDADSSASQLMTRLDKALAAQGIDPTHCMQRAICSIVQNADAKVKDNSASAFERALSDMSSKASAEKIFGSSEYQRALDVGRSSTDCGNVFQNCPLTSSALSTAVMSLVL